MKNTLDPKLREEIIAIGKSCGIEKIILFGSRARGDNQERSDIDLAVSGGDASAFYYEIEEDTHTLLMYDVVALDRGISEELRQEIERDGILLYEKVC